MEDSMETMFGSRTTNRSMPSATVIPVLLYPDVQAAVAWLCKAFGFTQRLRIGDHRAQLCIGQGALVVARGDAAPGNRNHSIMVRVVDADRHFALARDAGATILAEPASFPYGERQYTAVDLAGHVWAFSQSERDVDPGSWGGELLA